MKVIRVPWIQCRADEIGAACFEQVWKGRSFEIMAYTEKEAREWWHSLTEPERDNLLGLRYPGRSDGELALF